MPFRKTHNLGKGGRVTRPSRVIFLDTETSQNEYGDGVVKHRLKLGVAIYCRSRRGQALRPQDELVFYDNTTFWDWLDVLPDDKTKTLLVAHNLNYDLPVTHAFHELEQRSWKLKGYYSSGMVNIFRWKRGTQRLEAIDNGNFFPGSLDKWGQIVGYPKLAVEFDTVSDAELIAYCRRDVEIMIELWRYWMQFLDDNDCGAFRPTVASTAFGAFRHRYNTEDVWIHGDELAISLERAAYKGGRVECLFQGARKWGPFYYCDVNNMYGHVMKEHLYPISLWGSKCYPKMVELVYRLNRYSVIAHVKVNVTENWFPHKVNGRRAYPTGTFVTTLTTPELHLAYDNGWIEQVYAMAWYRQGRLFADYVDHFYSARKAYESDGNKPMASIAKLMINSLYGKFGQRGIKQWIDGECDPDTSLTITIYTDGEEKPYTMTHLGGQIIYTQAHGEGWNSFPAIAAHVTAYARLHLYRLMQMVPQEHRYYMDTDSLIVDEQGLSYLQSELDENKLGALKIERNSPYLIVNAPKDYFMDDHIRIKGIRADAELVAPNTYSQTQWSRLAGMLRRGNAKDYTTQTVTKTLQREVWSGEVQPSGWVLPFHLHED